MLLLGGVTGTRAEVQRLAEMAARIAPDRVQLNTVARPPAESFARPVELGRLQELATLFSPHAEVIVMNPPEATPHEATNDDVLALLSRRPCTIDDIAAGLGIHRNEALKAAGTLVAEGLATTSVHDGSLFYTATAAVTNQPIKETP